MFFEDKAAEQTEVSIVSSILSASSCSISLQCGGFLAIRPLTLPSPRSTEESGQVLVTKRVESETISKPTGVESLFGAALSRQSPAPTRQARGGP